MARWPTRIRQRGPFTVVGDALAVNLRRRLSTRSRRRRGSAQLPRRMKLEKRPINPQRVAPVGRNSTSARPITLRQVPISRGAGEGLDAASSEYLCVFFDCPTYPSESSIAQVLKRDEPSVHLVKGGDQCRREGDW